MKHRPALVAVLASSTLLVAVIVALMATAPIERARGAFPGRNGLIAFERCCNRYGASEIWVIRADGSHKRKLAPSRDGFDRVQPAFSPSGKRIAFVRDSRPSGHGVVISVMRADGTHKRTLAHRPLREVEPAFSRGGTHIVFEGWRSGGPHKIFKMRTDGTHLHPLTRPSECENAYSPAFSQTRPKIAFVCRSGPAVDIYNLYVMRADGTHLRRLTNSSDTNGPRYASPNFSPNGKKIAFGSFDPTSDTEQVYVMRADGTQVRRLTSSGFNGQPAFSPSGRRIAFSSFRDDRFGLYVARANGTHERRLAGSCCEALSPDWGARP